MSERPQPSGCVVALAAIVILVGSLWLLGAAIMLLGDTCAAPCVVVIILGVLCVALPVFIVRNWPKKNA